MDSTKRLTEIYREIGLDSRAQKLCLAAAAQKTEEERQHDITWYEDWKKNTQDVLDRFDRDWARVLKKQNRARM